MPDVLKNSSWFPVILQNSNSFCLACLFLWGMCSLLKAYTTPCVELVYLKNLNNQTQGPNWSSCWFLHCKTQKNPLRWGIQILKSPPGRIIAKAAIGEWLKKIFYLLDLRFDFSMCSNGFFLTNKNHTKTDLCRNVHPILSCCWLLFSPPLQRFGVVGLSYFHKVVLFPLFFLIHGNLRGPPPNATPPKIRPN